MLVNYLLVMEERFFGFTRADVRHFAFELAKKNSIQHPFNITAGTAGRGWYDLFLRRHKDVLSLRKAGGTCVARVHGFTRSSVKIFYDLLEETYRHHNFPATRIFNSEETGELHFLFSATNFMERISLISFLFTGITINPSTPLQVIARKGKRPVGELTAQERGALVTVICCFSASGMYIPPMLIFPCTNESKQLKKGKPAGSLVRYYLSGWVQGYPFAEWFAHFIDFTHPTKESPVLLILDGHYSHTRNLKVIDLARQNHVILISLPPHTTNCLQPLDRAYMSPFKFSYSKAIRKFIRLYGRVPKAFDVTELFTEAYVECQKAEHGINVFWVGFRSVISLKEFSLD